MPSSRLSAGSVDYWVDGSRRDVSLEEFYIVGPELGRQVCYTVGPTILIHHHLIPLFTFPL